MVGNGELIAVLRAVGGGIENLRLSDLPGWRRRPIVVRLWKMVLCRRNGLRRVIVSVFTGNRMVHKVRAIHYECAAIMTELIIVRAAPDG